MAGRKLAPVHPVGEVLDEEFLKPWTESAPFGIGHRS